MATYMRWKNDGPDSSKFTRFRDVMLQWNTTAGPQSLDAAGDTRNQQWMKAAGGT